MFRIDLTHSVLILLFCALTVLFTLLWATRFLRRDFYPPGVRRLIVLLRVIVLLLLLPLLAGLQIRLTRNVEEPPRYAFAWDLSLSMHNEDATPFKASRILNREGYRTLRKKIRIEHIGGMQEPSLIQESELRQRESDEPVTHLGNLLRFAERQARYRGIVLVSDGQSYLGEAPDAIRLKSGIPVYCIGVGDTLLNGRISLNSVQTPAFIGEGDPVPLNLSFENPSNQHVRGMLTILKSKDTLYHEKLELEARRFRDYRVVLPEMQAGIQSLDFYFDAGKGALPLTSHALNIFPSRIRIVCDSRKADPDIAMMNTVLSSAGDYRIYNRESWEKHFPGEKPDLLIQIWHPREDPLFFEDVPAILFYREPGNVYRQADAFRIADYRPYLLPENDPDLNNLYWKQLPPVRMLTYPGAGKAVLENSEARGLIFEDKANRRIIIAGSGLWVWHLAAYEKGWSGLYRHLLTGMVRESLKSGEQHFISLDRNAYRVLQYTPLTAVTQIDRNAMPDTAQAQISVALLDRDFREVQRRDHSYRSNLNWHFMPGDTGRYYLQANLYLKGEVLESDTAVVQVLFYDPETRYRGCDVPALKSLSGNHSGIYLHISQFDSLIKVLPIEKERHPQTSVLQARRAYAGILLLLILLCAEWIIRKRYGSV